jgi:hypothetical protein
VLQVYELVLITLEAAVCRKDGGDPWEAIYIDLDGKLLAHGGGTLLPCQLEVRGKAFPPV